MPLANAPHVTFLRLISITSMRNLAHDFRFALRTFKKSPVFVTVAVLSLAFGIGANTAIFTLVDQILLRLLPVKDPATTGAASGAAAGITAATTAATRSPTRCMRTSAITTRSSAECSAAGKRRSASAPKEERSASMASWFRAAIFQSSAWARRWDAYLRPMTIRVPGGHPIAVLSYRYWQTRFAGSRDIIGKKLLVDGYPITIIGVSQAGFDGTNPGASPQIRIPIMMEAQISPQMAEFYSLKNRRGRWVNAFGRMKPGVTMAQAKASLQPFFHQMLEMEVREKEFARAAPETKKAFLAMCMDLLPASKGDSDLRHQFASPLLVLMALVGLVLLIACANVANLQVARATARQKEVAVRLALGASRWRIISQLLVESLMLATRRWYRGTGAGRVDGSRPAEFPARGRRTADHLHHAGLADSGLFTLGISLLTGIVFGLAPALQSTRPDLAGTLKDQVGSIAGGTSVGLRKTLVAAQVALSLLLLIGAGLFIRSLSNLKGLDPGFRTANLISFAVDPPTERLPAGAQPGFLSPAARQPGCAFPAFESASLAVMPVLAGDEWDSSMAVEGFQHKPNGDCPIRTCSSSRPITSRP